MKILSVFSRLRVSIFLSNILIFGFAQVVAPAPAAAAPACVLNTDYTKDTSSVSGYTILKFTKAGSCSYRNTDAITTLDYLIVGGGGGGGAHVGGGGGGGGVLQATSYSIAGLGAIPITVGSGGDGAHANASGWVNTGSNGGNSSLNGVVAYGGGKGGIWQTYAPGYLSGSVGSAGGSGWSGNYGGGTAGQGRAGGTGFDVQPHAAGGGGGAGAVGGNGSQTSNGNGTGGKGGDGIAISITGTSTYYGGGGGGGVHGNNNYAVYTGGAGGAGGGGAGSSHSGSYYVDPRQPANYGFNGTANTGGGGGGSGGGWTWVENKAGNGGSGIVVIKYLNSAVSANSTDFAINTADSRFFYVPDSNKILPGTLSNVTFEAWINPSSTCDGSVFCSIVASNESVLLDVYQGKIAYIIGSGTAWCDAGTLTYPSGAKVPSGRWSHVALVRSLANVKIYINGFLVSDVTSSCSTGTMTAPAGKQFGVGYRQTAGQHFYGYIDEVKIWSTNRSAYISTDMHSNETSTSGLINYWNFNEGSGSSASNQAPLADSDSDLIGYGSAISSIWDSLSISTSVTSGPYTVRTFYRSYITQAGGWKVSSSIPKASIIIVGGGGSGGKGASSSSGPSGAGGGGGVNYLPAVEITNSLVPVKVGQGGVGAVVIANDAASRNGQSSSINYGSLATALGGGAGASFGSGISPSGSGAGDTSIATGGGSSGYEFSGGDCGGFGGTAGSTSTGYNGGRGVWGWGGAGGGARGAATNGNCQNQQGVPGAGFVDPVTSLEYGRGGYSRYSTAAAATRFNVANSGFGGSIAYNDGQASGDGYSGSAGIVIIRWITASAPTYTKPVNANLNVGMTETFTVNVTTDSATSMLTRTFKWESSTAGVNGPWAVIKQGTGASNAFFAWVPPDTSTSGTNFQYRLTVTDSDTAGLFISDSSTAYAVINGALGVSGTTSIGKTINSSRDETFTVTNGTPTYRYSLSPTISGITLDTRTAGYPILRIAETATVGTYLETLTVTDSVSATYNLPLTIKIVGPPTLSNGAEIVSTGQVFHIDSGNSASYTPGTSASGTTGIRDISGGKNTVTVSGSALSYSDDNGGTLNLSSANANYLQFTKRSSLTSWTIESYVRLASAPAGVTCVVTNQYISVQINYALCIDQSMTWFSGFHNGAWTYKRAGLALSTGVWYHLAGTYNSSSGVQLYLNGQLVTNISDSSVLGGTTPPAGDTQNVYIARRWDANTYLPMSIGAIRIYDTALNASQVQQNYEATRLRFSSENLNQIKPSQKHNTTTVETFTVTSGGDTKTVTFAVGNRTGIEWTTLDTATVKLTVKPDLVVGTFYDTITVTDNFSASTILPIRITISKGDQAKLSIGQYNAYPGRSTYPLNVTGGSGTGALTRTVTESGTAQCVLADGMMLTASKVGKCSVRVVKASDANFLAETGTATIFWIEWNDAYATRVPSTPTEIVLTHKTEIIRHEYETLTVTSYTDTATVANTITSARPGQTIRILGLGFVSTDTTSQATFADNEYADRTGLTNDYIQVVVPTGAVTGPVIVDTLKGQAIGPTLTILSP